MELYVTPASGGLRLFWLSSSSHQRWSQLQVRKVCGAARRRLGMFATFGRDKEFAECRAASQCLRAAYYGALPAEGQVSAPSWFHCIWLVKHTILWTWDLEGNRSKKRLQNKSFSDRKPPGSVGAVCSTSPRATLVGCKTWTLMSGCGTSSLLEGTSRGGSGLT